MKKVIGLAIATGLVAAASIFAAAPAQAANTATMGSTTDLHFGQTITLTLVDDGSFCDPSVDGAPYNMWGAFADVLDSDLNVVGSFSFFSADDYTGSAHTYAMSGTLDWFDSSQPAVSGDYTTSTVYCDAMKSAPNSDVDANALAFSVQAVTVSAMSVPVGSTFDVSVHDESSTWCESGTGPGYSMGIGLEDANGDMLYIPAGLSAGSGVKGSGDFDWQNVSATATVTIPDTIPAGTYTLFAGCVSPESDGYQQPGPGMMVKNFVVTAASLPATGLEASAMALTGFGALALIATGVVVVVRRRGAATRA